MALKEGPVTCTAPENPNLGVGGFPPQMFPLDT